MTPKERQPYAKQVWDMLQRSYAKIGGFMSAASPEELVNTPGYWKLIRRDGRITAVNIYKKSDKTNNYKIIASATETSDHPETGAIKATPQGLSDYNMMKNADIKTGRSWAEVSGPVEKMMLRAGAKPVSNQYAGFLTGKEIISLNPDGYHYTRLIQGEPHEKVIYGAVDLSPEASEELRRQKIALHDFPKSKG